MASGKPSVCLDSTIVSALFYRGRDIACLARQLSTRDWWEAERRHFRLYCSAVTEDELSAGRYPWKGKVLGLVGRLPFLPYTREVGLWAEELLGGNIVPSGKVGDALQLAFATVHGMDYLLTWNCAHLANAATQLRLRHVCVAKGLRYPLIVTPDSMPKASLGQDVRRRDP